MPNFSFNVDITMKNPERLAEIKARAQNLSVAFDNIIDEWASGNERKFSKGAGAETTGATLDTDVFWQPLTEKYRKRKEARGFENWLMKATGQLEATMTDPDGFFRAVNESEAIWGTPNSQEDEDKLLGNASRRTVVFFDRGDRLAIKREIVNYLTFGEKYKDILFTQGLAQSEAKRQIKLWDMEWQDKI